MRPIISMTAAIALAGICPWPSVAAQEAITPVNLDVRYELPEPYDPFAGLGADGRLTVTVEGAPPGTVLRVEPTGGAALVLTGAFGTINYVLRDEEDRAAEEGSRLEIPVPVPDGAEPPSIIVKTLILPGQVAPPGAYETELDLRLVSAADDLLAEALAVPVSIDIASRSQVILAGTSGAFDPQSSVAFVDFGTLESGEARNLFVTVRANASTRITVESANGGLLAYDPGEGAAPAPSVPGVLYDVDLDGIASDLSEPLVISRTPSLTAAGTAYPFVITIGDVSGLFAGTYRDDILIEVRPE